MRHFVKEVLWGWWGGEPTNRHIMLTCDSIVAALLLWAAIAIRDLWDMCPEISDWCSGGPEG